MKQVPIQTYIPERLLNELQAIADRELLSLSAVSRRALIRGLDTERRDQADRATGGGGR
jgi:hypothetical protein